MGGRGAMAPAARSSISKVPPASTKYRLSGSSLLLNPCWWIDRLKSLLTLIGSIAKRHRAAKHVLTSRRIDINQGPPAASAHLKNPKRLPMSLDAESCFEGEVQIFSEGRCGLPADF